MIHLHVCDLVCCCWQDANNGACDMPCLWCGGGWVAENGEPGYTVRYALSMKLHDSLGAIPGVCGKACRGPTPTVPARLSCAFVASLCLARSGLGRDSGEVTKAQVEPRNETEIVQSHISSAYHMELGPHACLTYVEVVGAKPQ